MDAQHPPVSIVDAYLQVAEARVRRLAGIPWGDGIHDLTDEDEEELLGTALGGKLPGCARCGAGELEHFYASTIDGCRLCADCFRGRNRETSDHTRPIAKT